MRAFSILLSRVRRLFQMRRLQEEMREEMRLHVEHRIAELRREGIGAEEARRLACIQFGHTSLFEEQGREALGWASYDALRRDLLFAGRQLIRSPIFSFVTIVTIAICLGVNGAAFAMLRELVLRTLPFPNSAQLVEVYNTFPKVGIAKLTSNVGQYLDFRANASALESAALWRVEHDAVAHDERSMRVATATATAELFELLSSQPLVGRLFSEENHAAGADKVVLLTESFWKERFQRDPHVIGTTLRINGQPHEILGVLHNAFEGFDASVKLVRPFTWDTSRPTLRAGFSPYLFARLRKGFSLAQANAQLASLEKAYLDAANPRARSFAEQTGQKVQVDTLQHQRSIPFQRPLLLVQSATLVLLLIAFTNVFNLFAARASARGAEFGIRAALGASANQIVRQIGVESGVICGIGVFGGIAIASLLLPTIHGLKFFALEGITPIQVSWAELAVMMLLGLAVWLVITIATSVQVLASGRSDGRLAQGSRTSSASRKARRLAAVLVAFQVALAFVASTSAVLLVLSFLKVSTTPTGLNPSHVISLRLDIPVAKEKELPVLLEQRLRQLPDVDSCVVSATPFYLIPPFNFSMPLGGVHIRGREASAAAPLPSVFYCGVTANYAEILGLKLVSGRWFSETEISSGNAVVIDERFRELHFGEEDAVGKWIVINRPPPANVAEWLEIIGVARGVPHNGAEDQSGHPFVYLSRTHTPLFGSASILAKTQRNPDEVLRMIRDIVRSADPDVPVYAERTLTSVIEASTRQRRVLTWLVLVVASVSISLAALGIYGTLAYDVSRRTREIGIRSAIGASRTAITLMFLRAGGTTAAVGMLAGTAIAVLLSQPLSGVLYQVSARHIGTYVGCGVALFSVCLLSSWFPAWRASRVEALAALRVE